MNIALVDDANQLDLITIISLVELGFNFTKRETSQRRSFYIDSLHSHCQDRAKTGCLKIWCQTNANATRIPELQTFGIMSELLAHIITKRIQCMIAIVFCFWFANHCLVSTLHDQIWQLKSGLAGLIKSYLTLPCAVWSGNMIRLHRQCYHF